MRGTSTNYVPIVEAICSKTLTRPPRYQRVHHQTSGLVKASMEVFYPATLISYLPVGKKKGPFACSSNIIVSPATRLRFQGCFQKVHSKLLFCPTQKRRRYRSESNLYHKTSRAWNLLPATGTNAAGRRAVLPRCIDKQFLRRTRTWQRWMTQLRMKERTVSTIYVDTVIKAVKVPKRKRSQDSPYDFSISSCHTGNSQSISLGSGYRSRVSSVRSA